jgi:hypothetical protein
MAEESWLEYEKGSETIRQKPQNYLIAFKDASRGGSYWTLAPDLSANRVLIDKVLDAIMTFDGRYGDGAKIVKGING